MSTIRVNAIQSTSTTDGGISIDTSGHVTLDGQKLPSAGPLSNRNLIINGAMQVAQRGTQVTGVTTADYRTCDRFRFSVGTLGTWTVDQDTNAPNGFSNSFKITCTTADASPASSDYLLVSHNIEAQNLQELGFGTSDAKPLTLSFWVRSNKTGNASFDLLQNDNSTKQVNFQYNISAANTWEHKTITIPADTAGVINNDNGSGLLMGWWLNSGSNFTSGSHQATWTTFANGNRNSSNLGVGGAVNDYWQITGVQLEVGSVATPFEHRSYGDELARCQRYYWQTPTGVNGSQVFMGFANTTTNSILLTANPVPMRAAPSFSSVSNWQIIDGAAFTVSSFTFQQATELTGRLDCTCSGLTTSRPNILRSNSTTATLQFSAEL